MRLPGGQAIGIDLRVHRVGRPCLGSREEKMSVKQMQRNLSDVKRSSLWNSSFSGIGTCI